MTKYTASMATWYAGSWHLDPATETSRMDEQDAILAGHALVAMGAFVLYYQYVNGIRTATMIEENKKLRKI